MAKSFCIKNGNIYELSARGARKYYLYSFMAILRRLICLCGTVLCAFVITWYVYSNCITPTIGIDNIVNFKLLDCITTGSLFATFGSAVIAVFSLYTTKYLTRFYDDVSILTQGLSQEESNSVPWKRWAFIPRISRIKFSSNPKFIGLSNAILIFFLRNKQVEFKLPTTEADIEEFAVLNSIIRMRRIKKGYFQALEENSQIEEYPVWNCVYDLYKCALFYRACNLFVWIGVCFVIYSIIFAFWYPELYNYCSLFLG